MRNYKVYFYPAMSSADYERICAFDEDGARNKAAEMRKPGQIVLLVMPEDWPEPDGEFCPLCGHRTSPWRPHYGEPKAWVYDGPPIETFI